MSEPPDSPRAWGRKKNPNFGDNTGEPNANRPPPQPFGNALSQQMAQAREVRETIAQQHHDLIKHSVNQVCALIFFSVLLVCATTIAVALIVW